MSIDICIPRQGFGALSSLFQEGLKDAHGNEAIRGEPGQRGTTRPRQASRSRAQAFLSAGRGPPRGSFVPVLSPWHAGLCRRASV